MQLIEIGIRSREQAKDLLSEIARGRPIQSLKQPKIWRISRQAAIEYMRNNSIHIANLIEYSEGEPRCSHLVLHE